MDVLGLQLEQCCAARRVWDGVSDLPTNALLVQTRDSANFAVLSRHRDLAIEVLGRVMDVHCQAPLVRKAARAVRGTPLKVLLGFESGIGRGVEIDTGFEAILLRELTARFVEIGIGEGAEQCA